MFTDYLADAGSRRSTRLLLVAALYGVTGLCLAQYVDWPLKTSPGTQALQAPARVVQDYSCVGQNLGNASPPTPDLDDRCAHETDKNYHSGVDLGAQAGWDGNVYAAAPGTIVSLTRGCKAADKQCNHGFGNEVVIKHRQSVYTRYGHLASVEMQLADDCKVRNAPLNCTSEVGRGDVLGKVESTGSAASPHLHFETLTNAATRGFGYDPGPPLLDGYLDPWGVVATTAVAPTVIEVIGSDPQGVELRRGPGNNYSAFARVKAGDRYVAFAEYAGWFRVHVACIHGDGSSQDGTKYNSCAGWMSENDLSVLAGASNLSVPHDAGAVTVRNVPNAGRGTKVLSRIVGGQRFGILSHQSAQPRDGCNATRASTWFRIPLPTKLSGDPDSGWVCGDAIAPSASADQDNLDCLKCWNGLSVESFQSIAQLFTVEQRGLLSQLDLGLYATPGTATDVVVDLLRADLDSLSNMKCNRPCSGDDLQESLFRTRVVVENLQTCTRGSSTDSCIEGPGTGFVSVDVRAAGLSVSPGETFAIVLSRPGGTSWPDWVISQAMEGPYQEGRNACASNAYLSSTYDKAWVCYPELHAYPSTRFRTWVE